MTDVIPIKVLAERYDRGVSGFAKTLRRMGYELILTTVRQAAWNGEMLTVCADDAKEIIKTLDAENEHTVVSLESIL